jgi:hypothetical protein
MNNTITSNISQLQTNIVSTNSNNSQKQRVNNQNTTKKYIGATQKTEISNIDNNEFNTCNFAFTNKNIIEITDSDKTNKDTSASLATYNVEVIYSDVDLKTDLLWIKSQFFKDGLLIDKCHETIAFKVTEMIKKAIIDNNNDVLFEISATLGSMFMSANTLVINNEKLWKLFVNFCNHKFSDANLVFARHLIDSMLPIIKLMSKGYQHQIQQTTEYSMENYPKWVANYSNLDPNQLIKITHGGGYIFIHNFLEGKNIGYRLEKGGLGLQVSPHLLGSEDFIINREIKTYAPRATYFLDRPARFEAQIAVKYLLAANNDYEAAIDSTVIKHLQNIKIVFV